MEVGYVRVSTKEQNLNRQNQLMNEMGIEKLFEEKESGKNIENRPVFQPVFSFIREGDNLTVTSLDRLGRNYEDIKNTVQLLRTKGVSLRVLDAEFLNFNTGNLLLDKAMFDMFLSLLSYISENEREKILERQRQGIIEAKKKGSYKDRKVEYDSNGTNPQKRLVYNQIVADYQSGKSISEIARGNGASRPTVYKIINNLT